MTPTLRRKLEALAERREELERLLSDPGVVADNERFRKFSREFSQLEPVSVALSEEAKAKHDLAAAEALRNDPEMRELFEEVGEQHTQEILASRIETAMEEQPDKTASSSRGTTR